MPKILFLVIEDWFFASHFLPMAQSLRDCRFQVPVATRVREDSERLKPWIMLRLGLRNGLHRAGLRLGAAAIEHLAHFVCQRLGV